MFVNKWRILDSAIRLPITKAPHVISACMSLHNLIISQKMVHPNAPLIRAPTRSFSRDHHLNTRTWVSGAVRSTSNDARVLYDTTDMNNIRNNIMRVMMHLEMKNASIRSEWSVLQLALAVST